MSVVIQSLIFRPDDLIEISYAEDRDQGEQAALFKTLIVQRQFRAQEVDEILDTLRDLVDDALVSIRNPHFTPEPSSSDDLGADDV